MTPEQLRPYIDLLTWQVVAVGAGVVFAPAIYLVVFRLRTLSMGLLSAGLSQREVNAIAKEVEADVEDDAAETTSTPIIVQQNAAEEISALPDETADKKEMYHNVVQAWLNLSVIVRTIAKDHGGQTSLKAYLANLEIITRLKLLPPEEIQRLRELHQRRFEFGRNPSVLTTQAYKSYLRRARRTANRLTKSLTPQSAPVQTSLVPPPTSAPEQSLPN